MAEESPKQRGAGDGRTASELVYFFSLLLFSTSFPLVSLEPVICWVSLVCQMVYTLSFAPPNPPSRWVWWLLREETEAQDAKWCRLWSHVGVWSVWPSCLCTEVFVAWPVVLITSCSRRMHCEFQPPTCKWTFRPQPASWAAAVCVRLALRLCRSDSQRF